MKPSLNNQRGEVGLLLILALVAGLLLWGGYQAIGWVADYVAEKVPDSFEKETFGSLASRQKDWKAQATSEKQKRALAIFEKLRKRPGLRDLSYQLHFLADKSPNAFAMPGGSIGVTQGLLDLVEGEVGLAMVLGHEFGHQQKRHALRMMGRSLLTAGVLVFFLGGDHGIVLNLALDVAQKTYSRDHEREADDYGLRMVSEVYGTTKGSLEFFQKIEKDPAMKDSKLMAMMSTHPYTPDRIKALKKLTKELEAKKLKAAH